MIHQVITPQNRTISISIPQEYVGKQIEVIAFAKHEGTTQENTTTKEVNFTAIAIDTRGYKFDRNEANDR